MKVAILAAGKGSRLGNGGIPKPLTVLEDGKSILHHQIEALERYVERKSIMLIVGYHKELVMDAFDDLLFVYNPHYASENTSKSLLRAIKKVDDDFLWINGDVLFHPLVLENLLSTRKNSMAVTCGTVSDEEVKYKCDEKGRIINVSKTLNEAEGEAVGVNFFKADTIPSLQQALEECSDNDFFEMAIEKCISQGIDVWKCPVESDHCTEIDFPEDLVKANILLQQWSDLQN